MSIAATVGIPVITCVPTCIHDGFVALENLKVDQRFLLYLLKVSEGKLRESGQSGSQMNVNTDIVKGLHVCIPVDLKEQERIAAVLWDADDLITTIERLIAKKQAIKQGMMQQLLTGRTRLPGFTGDWIDTRLGDVLAFQVGFPFRSEHFADAPPGLRLIRNRDLKSDDSIVYYRGPLSQSYIVESGDILVGMDGDFTLCRWSAGRALLNQRIGRVRPLRCVADFIYFALRQPLSDIELSTGATTVKHLSHNDVESIAISLPEASEQAAIAQVLLDADREIDGLCRRLDKVRSVKTGMMQQLLTGRVRLPVEAAA